MSDEGPVIRTMQLTRNFEDRVAVDHVDIEVYAGEVIALLGPNGAGKTTTVRLLNGVLKPTSGTIAVLGLDPVSHGNELRRRTGVMTEQAGLDERLTALDNVVAYAQLRGMRRKTAIAKSFELLDRFEVADRAYDSVQGFSTGQRKRVALARSLVHDPDVLFLDEPTSGLDPEATRVVLDLIGSLARDRGRTVILCTHFLAEANRLCKRMAVMQQGKLLAIGEPAELATRYWDGLEVEIVLQHDADLRMLTGIRDLSSVRTVNAAGTEMTARVESERDVPELVSRLVQLGALVVSVRPRQPTLEQVYFAVTGHDEARRRSNEASA